MEEEFQNGSKCVEERNTSGLADLGVEIFSVSGKETLHLAPRPAPLCVRSAMMAVCCQPSKGLETSKKLSRVGELSLAERLQGARVTLGARVTRLPQHLGPAAL